MQLAHDVTAQYEMITGEAINLFLDRDSLTWGDDWRARIDQGLQTAVFFVAIITPRFFMSSECRRELQTFGREAERLGVRDLILSIVYVDVPGLLDDTTQDDAIKLVKNFQWEDWRELRFADTSSSEYRKAVAKLAQKLVDANRRILAQESPVPADTTAPLGPDSPGGKSGEELGLIDILATGEEALPALTETMQAIATEINRFNEFTNTATEGIKRSDEAGEGATGRRIVARTLAQNLAEPTARMLELANKYSSQMYDVDASVRTLISAAPMETANDPDAKTTVCEFFETVKGMAQGARFLVETLGQMAQSLTQGESLSRDLRPPIQTMKQAITILVEASSVTDEWVRAIEASPVDCTGPDKSRDRLRVGCYDRRQRRRGRRRAWYPCETGHTVKCLDD